MCGRYVTPDEAALERFWSISNRDNIRWLEKGFNTAPTRQVPIIVKDKSGEIALISARWGLVPAWWKKDAPPSLAFNARSEEASKKPLWRTSFKNQRCIMPAEGWYEWNEAEPVKSKSGKTVNQPYFHHAPDSEVIAIAGLWSGWKRSEADLLVSCALLTKSAVPSVAAIHHRMPVILKPEYYEAWLDPKTSSKDVQKMIDDCREDFDNYAVSTDVNNARNDFPELLHRLATKTGEFLETPSASEANMSE